MDILQLPLVGFTDTIDLAMDRMKEHDARAIVVGPIQPGKSEHIIQMNTAVMKGYQNKIETVGQLQDKGIPLTGILDNLNFRDLQPQLDFNRLQSIQFRMDLDNEEWFRFERLLDRKRIDYVFLSVTRDHSALATIMTRHESYAEKIRNADKVCVCKNPKKPHNGDSPPHKDGDDCEFCNYEYICR